jgi:undecaprenyl diphosphate synthase
MGLLVQSLSSETSTLIKNNVRLNAIGDIDSLPKAVAKELNSVLNITSNNTGLILTLALSYSSRWEIVEAVRKIARKIENGELSSNDIDPNMLSNHLTTSNMPDPELLIRTSGEYRISNFLLWQIAYAELHFTPTLWPDFRRDDFYKAILDFQSRERRFGKISEQIVSKN